MNIKNLSDWRVAVLAKGAYCRDCGADDVPLHAHHIKPKFAFPELKLVVDNGVALCPTCHCKRHQADRFVLTTVSGKVSRTDLKKQLAEANRRIENLQAIIRRLQKESPEGREEFMQVGKVRVRIRPARLI